MRRLHRARERRGDALVLRAGRQRRRQARHDDRGFGPRRDAQPRAAGLGRRPGPAVRLLPERDDRGDDRAAREASASDRCADRRFAHQYLPVRNVRSHQGRDQESRRCRMKRSTFVATSAAAGGALVLGFEFAPSGRVASFADAAPTRLVGFVTVASDETVTIVQPQAEMGQGVQTSIPMLVAEELDCDWGRVPVESFPAIDKIYNNPAFGIMGTGGSSSVRGFFMPARKAGAQARAMLVAAAAQKFGVAASELRTQNGVVHHDASSRKATYGELAGAAATLTPPADVTLKTHDKFTLIGKPVKRLDIGDKVDGGAQFRIDVAG